MRIFRTWNYDNALPYQGQQARLLTTDGKWYSGRVMEVRRDGILFHSSNPGIFFLPFAAVALLALSIPFAFGAGYAVGRRPYYGSPGYAGYGAFPGYGYAGYPYYY